MGPGRQRDIRKGKEGEMHTQVSCILLAVAVLGHIER